MQSNAAPRIKNNPAAPSSAPSKPALTVVRGGARKEAPRPSRSSFVTIEFAVLREDGPALRSAVDEISNEVGGRVEGPHSFATEQALTNAIRALGALRAAIFAKFEFADPHYKARPARRS